MRIRLKLLCLFGSVLAIPFSGSAQQVVIVTGGSRGLGEVISQRLSRNGFVVYSGTRNSENTLSDQNLRSIHLDVTDQKTIDRAIKKILEAEGRIDVLVNNAGIAIFGSYENLTSEEIHRVFDVNYFGSLRMIQAVLPMMRNQRSGRIVQIGSRAGFRPVPSLPVYSDSKAALLSGFQVLAASLKPWNIWASIIEPGPILTEFDSLSTYGSRLSQSEDPYKPMFQKASLLAPEPGATLGDGGQSPDEIAELVEQVIHSDQPSLRYQTSARIEEQAKNRTNDPTGNSNVSEIQAMLFPESANP